MRYYDEVCHYNTKHVYHLFEVKNTYERPDGIESARLTEIEQATKWFPAQLVEQIEVYMNQIHTYKGTKVVKYDWISTTSKSSLADEKQRTEKNHWVNSDVINSSPP